MTAPFLTIAQDVTHEIIIKKSRFICSLFRVESEEQAQAAITQIKSFTARQPTTALPTCSANTTRFSVKATTASLVEPPAYQCWKL